MRARQWRRYSVAFSRSYARVLKKMPLAQSLVRVRGVADNDSAASTSLVRVRAILQRLFFSCIDQSLARVRAGHFKLNLASLAQNLARTRASYVCLNIPNRSFLSQRSFL